MKANARVEGSKLILEFPAVFTHPSTSNRYLFTNDGLDVDVTNFDVYLRDENIKIILDEDHNGMYWRMDDRSTKKI